MTLEDMVEYEKEASYKAGMEAGMEAGITVGIETGKNEGFIDGLISTYRDFGKSDEEIILALMDKFSLTRKVATQKVTDN